MPNVQDVILKRASTPGALQQYSNINGGLSEFDFMQQYASYDPYPQQRLDPLLMGTNQNNFEGNMFNNTSQGSYAMSTARNEASWPQPICDMNTTTHELKSEPTAPISESGQHYKNGYVEPLQILGGTKEAWSIDTLEDGAEFDKWAEDEHPVIGTGIAL